MIGARTLAIGVLALSAVAGCDRADLPTPGAEGFDIVLHPDTELIHALVPSGASFETLLSAHGLTAGAVPRWVAAVRSVFDPRRLRAAQPFEFERSRDGRLRRFDYEIDANSYLRISAGPSSDELNAEVLPIPKQRIQAALAGDINSSSPSLFQAMQRSGEQAELAIAMAEIFAGDIDFNTQLQPGDRFGLVFEKFTRDAHPTTYGDIAAAEFQNDGRVLRAIRFAPPGGTPAYYDEDGRSLRRFFLQSPLKFEPRITSGFTSRRFHPVLGTHRPHLGVDYGAPTGAPVVAVASGRVVSTTFDASNGRMVRLRHTGGYQTYYLHLSAFGPGIRAGAAVSQGQLIGLVGSTGLATGPHLDYRVQKNGVFVNPVTEHRKMPPGEPLPENARDAFAAERDRVLERLRGATRTGDSAASDPDLPPMHDLLVETIATATDRR